MALRKWLSETMEGYRVFSVFGLGELHVEIAERSRAGGGASFWEAHVHCREGELGQMCAVLHLIEETREELVRMLMMTMPALSELE